MSDEIDGPAGRPPVQPPVQPLAAGGAGRYTGSPSGVVGAMLLIVVLVLGVVVVRSLFRADADQGPPEPVNYLDSVLVLQQNGLDIVYPTSLPTGWIATDISADAGDRPTYRINLYTDDDTFVGIRQEDSSVDDLLATYVDDSAAAEDPLTGVGSVAKTWQGWSDSGGDHAYSAEVGDNTVLVFGDVSADELAGLVALLSTATLPGVSATPSPASTP